MSSITIFLCIISGISFGSSNVEYGLSYFIIIPLEIVLAYGLHYVDPFFKEMLDE